MNSTKIVMMAIGMESISARVEVDALMANLKKCARLDINEIRLVEPESHQVHGLIDNLYIQQGGRDGKDIYVNVKRIKIKSSAKELEAMGNSLKDAMLPTLEWWSTLFTDASLASLLSLVSLLLVAALEAPLASLALVALAALLARKLAQLVNSDRVWHVNGFDIDAEVALPLPYPNVNTTIHVPPITTSDLKALHAHVDKHFKRQYVLSLVPTMVRTRSYRWFVFIRFKSYCSMRLLEVAF